MLSEEGVSAGVRRIVALTGRKAAEHREKTMAELERVLPLRYRVEINKLMVPFGKNICTGKLPKCHACPVLEYCRQVGVAAIRDE